MRLQWIPLPYARTIRGAAMAVLAAAMLLAVRVPFAWAQVAAPAVQTSAQPSLQAADKGLSSAPDFTAQGVDGKTYQLQDALKKGPVLLDFWATWCKPCMMELPKIQSIWQKYRSRGFTLLTVAGDDQRSIAKLKPLIRTHGFKFVTLLDTDKKINNLYNVRNYPTSVLIAPDGKIAVWTEGYNLGDEKEMEAKIVALLPDAETGGTSQTKDKPQDEGNDGGSN
jgi:peroxiredoxin